MAARAGSEDSFDLRNSQEGILKIGLFILLTGNYERRLSAQIGQSYFPRLALWVSQGGSAVRYRYRAYSVTSPQQLNGILHAHYSK
jgi:hypothetical protein